jgi:hypothetical protein
LRGRNSAINAFCCEENVVSEVVTPHAFRVRDRIDLAENLDELRAALGELGGVDNNAPASFLLLLNL